MKTFKLLAMAALMLGAAACTDFEEPITPADETPTTRAVVDPAALRASAAVANPNNPYAVSNLNKAMIQYSKLYGVQPKPIFASHEYVRFQAKDSLDYYILQDSLNLELFDYPLDRILSASEMDFYSNDVENGGKWLYTAVPKYFHYPTEITRQVLQDVYLMDGGTVISPVAACVDEDAVVEGEENEENDLTTNAMGESLYEELLRISMQNAGIEFVDGPSSTGGKTWEPSALILYKDDLTGETLPLTNVKVRVNTMMNVGTGYTDNNGRVIITKGSGGRFRNPVNYEARFVTKEWKILSNSSGVAKISGDGGSKSSWTCIVEPQHAEVSAYAAVHRAMYHFFYKQNEIVCPSSNGKYRVAVFWDQNRDFLGKHVPFIEIFGSLANPIRITGKEDGKFRDRFAITGTTFHELGHGSMWSQRGVSYAFYDDIIHESYGRALQIYFLSQIYPKELIGRYRPPYDGDYTGIGEALLNQGYSISQIQQAVVEDYGRTWEKFKGNIKSFNVAPGWLVDYLFAKPLNIWDFHLLTESLIFDGVSEIVYLNIPKRIHLQDEFQDAGGAEIISLTALPNDMTVKTINNRMADLTFTKPGIHVLQANIRLANGVEFSSTKSVTVKTRPRITGRNEVRIGEAARYALDDNTYFKNWEIKYKKDGEWIDGNDKVIPIGNAANFTSQPVLNLVFMEWGEYEISATIDYKVAQDKVTYAVSVPPERIMTDLKDIVPGLFRVASWQHKTDKNLIQKIHDSPKAVVPLTYTRWTTNNDFYTFNMLPNSDHPYYSLMQPIYRYPYEGNEAYDNSEYYVSGNRLIPHPSPVKVFYVLKNRVPGSAPLYCVEVIAKDTKGAVLSRCRILSTNIGNTNLYYDWGSYQTTRIKELGYVFRKN